MMGFHTIRAGERVAVWNDQGEMRLVDGPRRLFLWGERIEGLPRVTADPEQYLVIRYYDGHKEHIRGPAAVWRDPVLHDSVQAQQAMPIDANEALVVYRQSGETVDRRVVRGPAMFVPGAEEWLHEFSWHGADPRHPQRKLPRALQFQKLRAIPDQMYFDVEDARTADDALLVVKLMIFFELTDIERMLDQTHDPIGDFINAVSADVIVFTAGRTFDQFKEQTERLNQLETYGQLVTRAAGIGYRINKVVYRGYHANQSLQVMHDNAIEARTQLRLESETERQAQELADLKLAREGQRAVLRQELEETELQHKNRLTQLAHDERLRGRLADQQARLAAHKQRHAAELDHEQAQHREQLQWLQGMHGLEVDLTKYLVAQNQRPDKLIQIDGAHESRFHMHEN